MKAIIYICVAGMITGCASDQASVSRWNDMWVDIALRHKFEKYSCAHNLEGYAKDPPTGKLPEGQSRRAGGCPFPYQPRHSSGGM
jgi:hypothetical protein